MEGLPKKQTKTTPKERARVFESYNKGEDWLAVAKANGISRTRAYALKDSRRVTNKKCGGVRAKTVTITPEIMITLAVSLENNPQITLEAIQVRVLDDYDVGISISTINRHLLGMTYTVKQVRMEPT